jgi:hypothetical protein
MKAYLSKSLILLPLIFIISCVYEPIPGGGTGGGGGQTPSGPRVPSDGDNNDGNLETIKVNAEFLNMDGQSERVAKLQKAVTLFEKALNSKLFQARVKSHSYGGVKAFIDNASFSNEEVLKIIGNGAELLKPDVDDTANLQLTFFYTRRSTVGYTTKAIMLIKLNTRFFDTFDSAHIAGNLAHEWMHKLGFDHDRHYSEKRDHSVPYAVGYMVRDIVEDIMDDELGLRHVF